MRASRALAAVAVLLLGVAGAGPGCGSTAAIGGADGGGGAGGGGDGGSLTCAGGQTDCSNACVDLSTDPANCGACGEACGSGARCCAGACVATAACTFAATSVVPATAWENGGSWATVHGSGFAAGLRVYVGGARAPVLVLGRTEARIEVPPGPKGAANVRITLGNLTATLEHGFTYETGQLLTPWQQKPMDTVRGEDPAVAVLQDGRVLVAGGTTVPDHPEDSVATAELFNRSQETVTRAKGPMSTPRWQDSAVTLLDGKVLVVGGACHAGGTGCTGDPRSADLFDPSTDTFTPTKGKLTVPRAYTRAVLLPDGRVFIASANDPSVDLYDPKTGTFTHVAHPVAHVFGFVVRLRDGRVMIGGGDGGVTQVELFDPDTNTFTPTGSLHQGRSMLTAHTLPDGRVMVIGGASESAGGIRRPLASIETWSPKTGKWTTAPYHLATPRCWQASALVRDGTVIVAGGYTVTATCSSATAKVEQIHPVKGTVTAFATLPNPNTEWTAVTLLDGSIIGVGGGACETTKALPDLDFLPARPGPG